MFRRLKGFRPIVFEFNNRFWLRVTAAVAICALALLLFAIMPSRSSARGFIPVVVAATPTNMVQIGQTEGGKTSYSDRSGTTTVASYTYKITAANASGEGQASNVVALTVGPRVESTGACMLPGVQVLVDPTGDASDTQAAHDITSVRCLNPKPVRPVQFAGGVDSRCIERQSAVQAIAGRSNSTDSANR